MTTFSCSNCGKPYPNGFGFLCDHCGGIFDVIDGISFETSKIDEKLPGIWQYQSTFGLDEQTPIISLGEGNTPMIWAEIGKTQVGLKLEYQNPTGSYKDRLTAPEISFLLSLNVKSAVEDSSGNAGASFAAYAARAGIRSRVFIPSYAAGPKRDQIETYGAEVVAVKGSREDTSKAVLNIIQKEGAVYASHAYLPQGLPGIATISYELFEQLGQTPGTVIAPVGHGGLLLGIFLGFEALCSAGVIDSLPTIIGVQAENSSPLWKASMEQLDEIPQITENETIAGGIRVSNPARGKRLLDLSKSHDIRFVTVEEDEIIPGRDCLARLGFYVEPTSAVVWNALSQVVGDVPEPIMLILTGSGLKYNKA